MNKALSAKPAIAVYKFSSCDGCQLALLNMGSDLLALSQQVNIRYFAEAGPLDEQYPVDIAFIEGSIACEDDIQRLKTIRHQSKTVVSIGACATSGGIQALRNPGQTEKWQQQIYARPDWIHNLSKSHPLEDFVRVDYQLWGCPVNTSQISHFIQQILMGVAPLQEKEKLCLECKRRGNTCIMVTRQQACMGAITQTGCGAICPGFGRACFNCYGPSESPNIFAFKEYLQKHQLSTSAPFEHINSHAWRKHHD